MYIYVYIYIYINLLLVHHNIILGHALKKLFYDNNSEALHLLVCSLHKIQVALPPELLLLFLRLLPSRQFGVCYVDVCAD